MAVSPLKWTHASPRAVLRQRTSDYAIVQLEKNECSSILDLTDWSCAVHMVLSDLLNSGVNGMATRPLAARRTVSAH